MREACASDTPGKARGLPSTRATANRRLRLERGWKPSAHGPLDETVTTLKRLQAPTIEAGANPDDRGRCKPGRARWCEPTDGATRAPLSAAARGWRKWRVGVTVERGLLDCYWQLTQSDQRLTLKRCVRVGGVVMRVIGR